MHWINRVVVALLSSSAIVALADDALPDKPPVKVEYFWAESNPVPGVTSPNSRPFGEAGDMIYPHLKPILTNKDIIKAEVHTLEFKNSTQAPLQFQVQFQLTDVARKRLAETCPADGDGLLAAFVDGDHRGTSFYVKSRDEARFAPTWGYTLSKAKIDQIVATFAPATVAAPATKAQNDAEITQHLQGIYLRRPGYVSVYGDWCGAVAVLRGIASVDKSSLPHRFAVYTVNLKTHQLTAVHVPGISQVTHLGRDGTSRIVAGLGYDGAWRLVRQNGDQWEAMALPVEMQQTGLHRLIDSDGPLAIAIPDAVFRWQDGNWKKTLLPPLGVMHFTSVAVEADGLLSGSNYYIGWWNRGDSTEGGFVAIDLDTPTPAWRSIYGPADPALGFPEGRAAVVLRGGPQGQVWLDAESDMDHARVYEFDGRQWHKRIDISAGLPADPAGIAAWGTQVSQENVGDLRVDKHGILHMLGERGIFTLRDNKLNRLVPGPIIGPNSLYIDDDGGFLVGTPTAGLLQFEKVEGGYALHELSVPQSDTPPRPADKEIRLSDGWTINPAGAAISLPAVPLNILPSKNSKSVHVATGGVAAHELSVIELETGKLWTKVNVQWSGYGLSKLDLNGNETLIWSGGASGLTHFVHCNGYALTMNGPSRQEARDAAELPGNVRSGIAGHPSKYSYAALDIAAGNLIVSSHDPASSEPAVTYLAGKQPLDVAWSRDGQSIYVSDWADNRVLVFSSLAEHPANNKPRTVISVGERPNQIAVHPTDGRLFVACAGSNSVSVIDGKTDTVIETISTRLEPTRPEHSKPDALTLAPDGKTLYVANAGSHNVAVIDVTEPKASRVMGFVPTGWNPTAVSITPNGNTLLIGTLKPADPLLAIPDLDKERPFPYVGTRVTGELWVVPVPNEKTLGEYTVQVRKNCPVQAREGP